MLEPVVVGAPVLLIGDQKGERRAGSDPVHETGDEVDPVTLPPCGRSLGGSSAPAGKLMRHLIAVDSETGRAAVDDPSDTGTMRLAKGGKAKELAVGIHTATPSWLT